MAATEIVRPKVRQVDTLDGPETREEKEDQKQPIMEEIERLYRLLAKSSIHVEKPLLEVYEEVCLGVGTLRKEGNITTRAHTILRPVAYIYRIPYSARVRLVCTEEELPRGWVEGYLYPLDNIQECSENVMDEDINSILEKLGKKRRKGDADEEEVRIEELMAEISVYKFTRHHPDLGRRLLERWEDFRDELFHPYDPWVRDVYEAYLTVFLHPAYAPHVFLITNTGVGKTTLASVLGEEVEDATMVGLVGGMIDKKIRQGILHGKDYLVQISKFESKDKDAIAHLNSLLANGYTERAIGATKVRTRFSGALVFTGNVNYNDARTPLLELLSRLSNPNALGSRFLFLVNGDLLYADRTRAFNVFSAREALMSARMLVRKNVYALYREGVVVRWLDEEPEEWNEIANRIEGIECDDLVLKTYLKTFAKEGYRKWKALGLARAISTNLDRVWREEITPSEAIRLAEEYMGDAKSGYGKMMLQSINALTREYEEDLERFTINLFKNKKGKFVRYLIDGLAESIEGLLKHADAVVPIDPSKLAKLIESMAQGETGKRWGLTAQKLIERIEHLRYHPPFGVDVCTKVGLQVRDGVIYVDAKSLRNFRNQIYETARKLGLA